MPVALVTGASRGLGKEIARILAKNGYSVVLNYLTSGKEVQNLIKTLGQNCLAVKADIRETEQVQDMAVKIKSAFGRIDAIINNAGITKDNLLLKQSEQEWDAIISTNLKGCFNTIKTLTPIMIQSGGGHIVNIASYSGVKGRPGQAAYSASKASLLGLTVTAAAELGRYNIRVNALLPGYMMTDMGMNAPNAFEKAKAESMLNRVAEPGEVAECILHLLNTTHMTGQVLSLESRIISPL